MNALVSIVITSNNKTELLDEAISSIIGDNLGLNLNYAYQTIVAVINISPYARKMVTPFRYYLSKITGYTPR